MSDGTSSGQASSIEGASEAYKAAKLETEAFYGNSVRDAAPELLAALELILKTHDLTCKGEECQISGIDLGRAAIAKARGIQS